ncbi:MBL fold metallo-hydrolase [Candidatus Pacearchaeota archaeon]|nr:MBL fold metallo-hydrolase [Candidatus Pacearchaeota archaeon]
MDINGIKIDFLGHDGFLITMNDGKRIAVDPYNVSDNAGKADYILITHSHYDHCSIKDIEKLSKPGTVILVPPDAQSKITRIDGVTMEVLEAGDEMILGTLKIEAVPAYCVNKPYHPKSEGFIGYIIKQQDTIVYHAGDTDYIPEMKKLSGYGKHGNHFIALLPVSGTYVMSAEEAAEAASIINPDLAIPMHYGAGVIGTVEDAQRFVKLCEEKGITAKMLERII